jgi:hypothetical protein
VSVDQVYQIVLLAVAKNLQQGYVSPNDFYIAINQAQRGYLDYLKGEYQRFQIQRPIAVVQFGQNESIRTSLAPLVYGAILPIYNNTGISPFPNDFEEVDNLWTLYGMYDIRFVQQPRLANFKRSTIDPIADNPVYLIKHEGFQFYPEDLGFANLSYYRTPPSIVWAYVEDSNGNPVYDPTRSQDPVWSETDIYQIIVRALQLLGVSMQYQGVVQYATQIKEGGQ